MRTSSLSVLCASRRFLRLRSSRLDVFVAVAVVVVVVVDDDDDVVDARGERGRNTAVVERDGVEVHVKWLGRGVRDFNFKAATEGSRNTRGEDVPTVAAGGATDAVANCAVADGAATRQAMAFFGIRRRNKVVVVLASFEAAAAAAAPG